MRYTNIIEGMTWSYSRLKSFMMCPYQFLLKYIMNVGDSKRQFFSDYGSFIHKIIEEHLKGQLEVDSLAVYFLTNFSEEIQGMAPSKNVLSRYISQGNQYLSNFHFPYEPYDIEKEYEFEIDGFGFVGIIDCVAQDDNELVLVDNKSRALKPRSKREKPTATDVELDEYLKQLYLYSIPIKCQFGKYPDRLEFNCFRTQTWISEPFVYEDFLKAKEWAVSTIKTILYNDDWSPKMDYWKCKYICDQNQNCEYYKLNER